MTPLKTHYYSHVVRFLTRSISQSISTLNEVQKYKSCVFQKFSKMTSRPCFPKLNYQTIKLYCSSTVNPIEIPKKSIRQKLEESGRALLNDYKDAIIHCGKHMKEHPFKSGVWLSLLASFLVCRRLNPDENNFRAKVIAKSNELIFVGKPVRNPDAEQHLRNIASYYNRDQIRRINFGIFSLILRNLKSSRCDSYKENCSYVQASFAEILRERIIDVGFFDRWWIFERKMIDFDINPNEWKDSK